MNSNLSYLDTLKAMNGNLVALCSCPSQYITPNTDSSPEEFPVGKNQKMIISNKTGLGVPNKCYGYGVVRAIDLENSVMFLLTSVPKVTVETSVNTVICGGSIGVPLKFYLNSCQAHESEGTDIPFVITSNTKTTSKLHTASKRQFIPNRISHVVLDNCVMENP